MAYIGASETILSELEALTRSGLVITYSLFAESVHPQILAGCTGVINGVFLLLPP